MREIINTLKQKPEDHRKKISVITSAFITLIIAGGYFGYEYRGVIAREKIVAQAQNEDSTQKIDFKSPLVNLNMALEELGGSFREGLTAAVAEARRLLSNDTEYVQTEVVQDVKPLEEVLIERPITTATSSATSSATSTRSSVQ